MSATILVVDDLEENRLALQALLEDDLDVSVLTAASGPEALELLLRHDDIALALLDVQMPDMDGFELAELMRGSQRTRRVPIIFVSAAVTDSRRVFHGYGAGAVDYLLKPLEPHVLKSKVAVFVELHEQRRVLDDKVARLSEATAARDVALAELRETLKLNELFVGVVGHDLRSPLSALLTAAALLGEVKDDADAVDQVAARMTNIGTRMARLIRDLLDLTRARLAGGIPMHVRAGDVGVVVNAVVDEARLAFPQRSFSVVVDGDVATALDADRFGQALQNLVQNAAVHGAPGTDVVVSVTGGADHVDVVVRNAGEIPQANLERLFDPFAQGTTSDGERARSPGLGLGLFIVDQILRAHGGSAHASSEGGFTEFRLRLPARRPTTTTSLTAELTPPP